MPKVCSDFGGFRSRAGPLTHSRNLHVFQRKILASNEANVTSETPNAKHWQMPACQNRTIRLCGSTVEKARVSGKGKVHSKWGQFVFVSLVSAKGGRHPLEELEEKAKSCHASVCPACLSCILISREHALPRAVICSESSPLRWQLELAWCFLGQTCFHF